MKAIIFPRVSTEAQSYEEQKAELIQMALSDGYKDNQLVIIENKESAIKLDEEHREGIIDMKRCIENDKEINCVYIWEVSRWARKKYILFNLQHYLVERKIQLKVKHPDIVLLDENGNLSSNADWMFTIFAQLAETEMYIKVQRFIRAKRERKREGYKIGGRISFGYYADETKKIHIDDKDADIVRKIFKWYRTMSISQICDELKSFGYNITYRRISLILQNKAYISQLTDKDGLPIYYPRILTDEEFYEVQELLKQNTKVNKNKLYGACTKLIVCPECGKHFIQVGRSYVCNTNIKPRAYKYSCNNGMSLSVKYMDMIAADFAYSAMVKDISNKSKNEKSELKQEIKDTKTKINVTERKIKNIDDKKRKLAKLYLDDEVINDAEYNKRLTKIKDEAKHLEMELNYLINKEINLKDKLEHFTEHKMTWNDERKMYMGMKREEMNEQDIYQLTHKYIKTIRLRKLDGHSKVVQFESVNGLVLRTLFTGIGKAFKVLTNSELQMYEIDLNQLTESDFIEDYFISR